MNTVQLSMRKHIALIGAVNSGKSSLFNALLGQDIAIVSSAAGTTTDPIVKAFELLGFGAVALIDTAGFADYTKLGAARVAKTVETLKRADLFLHVLDSTLEVFPKCDYAPFITVFTKCNLLEETAFKALKNKNPDAVFLSTFSEDELAPLREKISAKLKASENLTKDSILRHVPKNSSVVLVVPLDAAAPAGRLILPQVNLIRDCLDHEIVATVCRETNLAQTLKKTCDASLVVTDSQIFGAVSKIVPKDIMLTSFSIILAYQSYGFSQLYSGISALKSLKTGAKILVLEGCSHNKTHEDIGQVKIPNMLEKVLNKSFDFTFKTGYDQTANLREFDFVISCGSCMLSRAYVSQRLLECKKLNVPISNYGLVLAYLSGILERSVEFFVKNALVITD